MNLDLFGSAEVHEPCALVVFDRPGIQALTYRIPPVLREQIEPGVLVRAPLAGAEAIGAVIDIGSPPPGLKRIVELAGVATPGFSISGELLGLARWVSDYYMAPIGECVAAASLVGLNDVAPAASNCIRLSEDWRERSALAGLSDLASRAHAAGADRGVESRAALARALQVGAARIARLAAAGVLVPYGDSAPRRSPTGERDAPHALSPDQAAAFEAVRELVANPAFGVFLLFGITGSGKTEIYLRAIADVLAGGRTALVLVPEVSLTPQTVARLEARFGEPVGVRHGGLTHQERLRLDRDLQAGRVRVVIGARSAVFTPLPRLGIIVVDEEHEHSYKQADAPAYHARDVAVVRARNLGIPVILGSATPSLESFENARRGRYRLLELRERPGDASLPEVRIVDLGKAARAAVEAPTSPLSLPPLISTELHEAIRARLDRGEQSLLLLNRRGFSSWLFCPGCKWVARCDDDDVALTVHRPRRGEQDDSELDLFAPARAVDGAVLRCHMCGKRHDFPAFCPHCGGDRLMAIGSGTQRVEEELRSVLGDARILRTDLDTAGSRRSFLDAWRRMVSGEAQVIIGTQMIAKGLHLERVTLVGVLLCDLGLFVPDFRSEERVFSLLSQVAGRAGRAAPGEVLLQTFMPGHPAINFAAAHDYPGFFEYEMERRRQLRFPPVQRLVAVTISDASHERSREAAAILGGILRRLLGAGDIAEAAVRGPLPAPVTRIGGRFRERLLLRGPSSPALVAWLRRALADPQWRVRSSSRVAVDVDPVDLL